MKSPNPNISFTFSLRHESLKDIYIQMLRVQELDFKSILILILRTFLTTQKNLKQWKHGKAY